MERYQNSIQDRAGNAIYNALITVTTTTGSPAVVYSDNGSTILPQVRTDDKGMFAFYVANGRYNLAISGDRIVPYTLTDVFINDTASSAIIVDSLDSLQNVAAIKLLVGVTDNTPATTLGYYVPGDGGAWTYLFDLTDTTTPDNGITCIVANDGGRWKSIDPLPKNIYQCGVIGDGVSNDTTAFQNAIDLYKDVLNPTTDWILNPISPRVLDLCGANVLVDTKVDFADMYYFKLKNGQITADDTATWSSDPVLYVAKPQATDINRAQKIRFVTLENIKVNGNMVANGIYLENTYAVTLFNVSVIGWPTGGSGIGIWTSQGSDVPETKNSKLTLINVTCGQYELSQASSGGDGTGISLKSADFKAYNLSVNRATDCVVVDDCYNTMIVGMHTFCGSTDNCLIVGPTCHNLTVADFYSDTGHVLIQSFHAVFTGCIFVASSKVTLEAQVANETGAGLVFAGCIMAQPQFTEIVGASWVTQGRMIQMLSMTTEFSGKVQGQRIVAYGTGRIALDADNAVHVLTNDTQMAVFDSSDRLILSGDTSSRTVSALDARLQAHSTTAKANFNLTAWGNNNTGPSINTGKSRSTTVGTYGGFPLSGDILGKFEATGDNGSNFDTGGARITFSANENWSSTANGSRARIHCTANGATAQTGVITVDTTQVIPFTDNAINLGSGTNRWKEVFAVAGTINTSDEREKKDIAPVQDGLSFIKELKPISYKWKVGEVQVKSVLKKPAKYDKKGELVEDAVIEDIITEIPGTRTHYGFTTQDIKAAADKAGMSDYAGWVLTKKEDPTSLQGYRDTEITPFIVKAIQELAEEIKKLKVKP